MNAVIDNVQVSPVNMADRQALGIKPGDTVKVHQKIQDKGKTRIQVFDGVVLARKHGDEPGATFTVRKITSGVGVEKIFPLYSPLIDKIEIVKRAKVRRAKLYYIREKVARQIKRQMRRMSLVSMGTESEIEAAARKEAEAERAEAAAQAAEAETVSDLDATTDKAQTDTDTATETTAESDGGEAVNEETEAPAPQSEEAPAEEVTEAPAKDTESAVDTESVAEETEESVETKEQK